MTGRSQSRPPKTTRSTTYKPRFVNPHPLPRVEEFQLDHILSKVLANESAAVSESLSRTAHNYQQDLKREIRRALTFEQKIQNKNIHAIKRTHKLTKQWHNTRKTLAKSMNVAGDQGKMPKMALRPKTALGPDLDNVFNHAIAVSTSVKRVAVRMADISRKRGGSGSPDPSKYPRLSKLLATLDSAKPKEHNFASVREVGREIVRGHRPRHAIDGISPEELPFDTKAGVFGPGNGSAFHTKAQLPNVSPEENNYSKKNTDSSSQNLLRELASVYSVTPGPEGVPRRQEQKKRDAVPDVDEPASPLAQNNIASKSDDDTVMDADTFEQFMNVSIAKYRERVDERNRSIDAYSPAKSSSTLPASPKSSTNSLLRKPRNPLRLLSAGTLGSSMGLGLGSGVFLGNNSAFQSVKSSPFLEESDPFKYSFLPRKSAATVLETPESSLHKKLRISVLPSPLRAASAPKCGCSTVGRNATTTNTSPYRPRSEGFARRNSGTEGDVWSSSEAPTETDNDSDAFGISSSSDGGSSSDSLGGHIGETNNYYVAFQSKMKNKHKVNSESNISASAQRRRRRRSKRAQSTDFRKESSPTPKHQPSHRSLQPKQSILKLKRAKDECKVITKIQADPVSDVESIAPFGSSLTYTSSPRASFVNDCPVHGVILQGTSSTRKVDYGSMDEEEENAESVHSRKMPEVSSSGSSGSNSTGASSQGNSSSSNNPEGAGAGPAQEAATKGIREDKFEESQAIDKLKSLMI